MNITGRIQSPAGILKHPANDSTAKYHYSFSKSSRFPQPKNYTNTISYDLPSTKSRRMSGFGHGSRSKFFDGQNTANPAPTQYRSKSAFENYKDRRGYSFGGHRDQIKFANYLNVLAKTPAPYTLNESQVKASRAYSLRSKTAYPKNYFLPNDEQKERITQLPGPGNYQTLDMMGSGKDFYNSKFKNQKQKTFHGGDRFSTCKESPGPGDYTFSRTIQPDGQCFLSNMKSHGRRPILNERRELRLDGNKYTPGPGEYTKPSDFGHYDKLEPKKRPSTARN